MSSRHTPGPWHVNEDGPIIRIHFSLPDGRESGIAVSIGSTALQFRAPRQGSHRGEKMVYRPFAEHDRDDARLIAAAPELLDALKHWVMAVDLVATDSYCEVCNVHAPKDDHGHVTGPVVHYGCPFDQARAAIAKAEGR